MSELINKYFPTASGAKTVNDHWEAFLNVGLPDRKSEEYKFTPITNVIEREMNFDSITSDSGSDPGVETLFSTPYHMVFLNGKLVKKFEGNDIISVAANSDIPASEKFIPNWKDEFHLMNKGLEADGVYLKIAKGNTLEQPVYIQYVVDSADSQSAAVTRNYFHAEENSEFQVVEEFIYLGENASFENTESHVVVGKAARVRSYKLQLQGKNQLQVGNTFVQQERDSYHKNITITMSGKMVRNNLQIFLNDEHCESHLHGLYMLNGKNHVDNHTTVDHRFPNSYSNEMYKGILTEYSTGVFNGKIYVRPDAQNTNAFQSNNNLLLSDTATLHTKPQLEIWADDVSCSHGCTSGQLDKEALFYLRSRGLGQDEAKALLLKAFVADVLNEIDIEPIKEKVESQVDSVLFTK